MKNKLNYPSVAPSMLCLAAMAISMTLVTAGPAPMVDVKDTKDIAAPPVCSKDWTVEFGTGVTFSNVRTTNNASYTIVPSDFTASLKIDDVSNDNFLGGIFRGNTEFFFRGDIAGIVHGPEDYYAGVLAGPRYNFVQPGWKIVPYIEAGVGILFSDSNPAQNGLGQDFNFTFTTAAGIKYNFSDDWYFRGGVEYRHISNAGLSDPIPNNAIDALGPRFAIGYSF